MPLAIKIAVQPQLLPPIKDLTVFSEAKIRIDKLVQSWSSIETAAERNRKLRYFTVDLEAKRQDGTLRADETYLPTRLIDSNIRREQPKYIAYLAQSRRAAVMRPVKPDPVVQEVDRLESLFTDVARYPGWEVPFIRVVDGAMLHGWDFVEVVFDIDKPGHFAVEHVGHGDLIFDLDTRDIEDCELLPRKIMMSGIELRANIERYGFNPEVVKEILDCTDLNESKTKDVVYPVYKVFMKIEDIVWLAWYSERSDKWLKEPAKFYNGLDLIGAPVDPLALITDIPQPTEIPETSYPFVCLRYSENEDPRLTQLKGRAALDEYDQEGASALISGFVNNVCRSANMYASPAGTVPTDGAAPKQTDIIVSNGRIYDKPMNFAYLPTPSETAIKAFQMLSTKNATETSNVDYAAQNRQDSRKTATEIASAESKSAEMAGVQVTLLSIFIRSVYNKCWLIYQNRVINNKITVPDELLPYFVADDMSGVVAREYYILSSGDIDVVKRQEKLQRQMQAWSVVSATPIAMEFLKDILRNAFPEDAERYFKAMDTKQQTDKLLVDLYKTIQALAMNPETGQLEESAKPFAQQFEVLGQQVSAAIGQGQQQGQGQ